MNHSDRGRGHFVAGDGRRGLGGHSFWGTPKEVGATISCSSPSPSLGSAMF